MRLAFSVMMLWGGIGALTALPAEAWALASDRYGVDMALHLGYHASESADTASQEPDPVEALVGAEPLNPSVSITSPAGITLDLSALEISSTADPVSNPVSLDDDSIETLDFDVPIVRTPKVDRHVQFFTFQIRDRFEMWLGRLERHRGMVQSIFAEFNLPSDLVFLSLVESGFSTSAVSRSKAVGPWQFIKSTAKMYDLRVDNWIDERRDPVKSTLAAAQYLRDLYHLFGSWPLAMAAYNAGEGKVGRALARTEGADYWDLTDTKLLKRETKEYVPRFLAAALIAKDPARFGLTIAPQSPMEYESVAIFRPLNLRTAAKAAGVSYEALKVLNPELKKDLTPPDLVYHLRVPAGTKDTLLANLSKFEDGKRVQAIRYQVRRGDTLARLASRHRTTAESIMEGNALDKSYRPTPGDWLLISKPAKAVAVASRASTGSPR